jgi:hypothetical protein
MMPFPNLDPPDRDRDDVPRKSPSQGKPDGGGDGKLPDRPDAVPDTLGGCLGMGLGAAIGFAFPFLPLLFLKDSGDSGPHHVTGPVIPQEAVTACCLFPFAVGGALVGAFISRRIHARIRRDKSLD